MIAKERISIGLFLMAIVLLLNSCQNKTSEEQTTPEKESKPLAKFEPPKGKCLLFVGQDLESVGGLDAPYNDGYFDHFPKPGGFTMYTGFSPGQESFGHIMKGLDGVWSTDDYVDWCSYSFFGRWQDSNMINFARKKGKPVFIAEATPTIGSPTVKQDGKTIETILSNPQQAEQAWNEWFVPFFKTIKEDEDVVKAISYINCHWKSHRMWFDNPHFQDVDARLQTSDFVSKKWMEEISLERFKVKVY